FCIPAHLFYEIPTLLALTSLHRRSGLVQQGLPFHPFRVSLPAENCKNLYVHMAFGFGYDNIRQI
ncbi:hypothetical protein, partial [Desulfobacter sp.]|uniref:hypothetical protein n=1 Tax=Desulfobacter sp. TaxID=2294 RepID=UPI003D134970